MTRAHMLAWGLGSFETCVGEMCVCVYVCGVCLDGICICL